MGQAVSLYTTIPVHILDTSVCMCPRSVLPPSQSADCTSTYIVPELRQSHHHCTLHTVPLTCTLGTFQKLARTGINFIDSSLSLTVTFCSLAMTVVMLHVLYLFLLFLPALSLLIVYLLLSPHICYPTYITYLLTTLHPLKMTLHEC